MVEKVAQFKDRLRLAIDKSGLSQAAVARKAGIRRQIISDYLKGKYEAKQENIYRLAKALDVNEAWLMGLSDSKVNSNTTSDNTKANGNVDEEKIDEIVAGMRSFGGKEISEAQKAALKASIKGILKGMDN
ncbi:helix-turn-helix domain-containing protein [Limosilactobacillus vaginalis]|uniref:helix-turn-helix domain-containing protein n=1 Tax=Limosilactobacillus vaginalis TaxID=1633 RepID=UPI0021B6C3CF|nr:helix-turn-helix domain-containing protein [Limosilactobacillus vaginalis]UXC69716.1 helix-turn-helix domain-containing protein [Limosilactobacillus vaginalis]